MIDGHERWSTGECGFGVALGELLLLMVGKEQKVSFYCMVDRRWEDPNVQMIDDVHGCPRVVMLR